MLVGDGRPRTQSPTSGHPGGLGPSGGLGPRPPPKNFETFSFPLSSPPLPARPTSRTEPSLGRPRPRRLLWAGSYPVREAQPSFPVTQPGPLESAGSPLPGWGGIIHFCSLHSCQPAAHLQCPGSAWGQWTARPAVKGLRSAQPKTGGGFPDSPGSLVSSDNLPMNLLVVTLQSSGPGSSCKNAPPSQPYPKALNSSEVLHII